MQETIRPAAIAVGEEVGTVVATALLVVILLFSPRCSIHQEFLTEAIHRTRRHSFPRLSKI